MIIGYKRIEEKLNKMANVDLRPGVSRAIGLVQGAAKTNCSGFKNSSGTLRQSILTATEVEGDICRGICWPHAPHAIYVEFGTGPNGQASHEGISPEVAVTYSQTGWMIPGDAMSLSEAEAYGFGIAKGPNGEPIGYYTNGQAAHPFMYPALKDNEKKVTEIIAESIRSQL